MSGTLVVATLGDINIDSIVDISDQVTELPIREDVVFTPLYTSVGGNGVFFAQAAAEAGYRSSLLLTNLGAQADKPGEPDLAAQYALQTLRHMNVEPVVRYVDGQRTGQVLIIYYGDDQRFMVADRGANASFSLDLLPPDALTTMQSVDHLHVSGYCLRDAPQRTAVNSLVAAARNSGGFVSVDMVPHSISRSMSLAEFVQLSPQIQAVAAEGPTICGFLGLAPNDPAAEQAIGDSLLSHYEFCVVRLNERSDILVADRTGRLRITVPYQARINSLRFTDRVVANIIHAYLTHGRLLDAVLGRVGHIIHLTSS